MKRFNFVLAAALTATLVLTACDITIVPPGPPTPDVEISSLGTPDTPRWDGTIANGDDVVFKLSFPAVGASNVVYVELESNLSLELKNPKNFTTVASSHGPSYFARDLGGLSSTSLDGLDSQAIGPSASCGGSCIIISGVTAKTYFARVTNDSGASVATSLYFFSRPQADLEEPNDSPSDGNPTSFDMLAAGGDTATIELLDDVDFWTVNRAGSINFITKPGNPVNLAIEVVNSTGVRIAGPFAPSIIQVFAGDILKVYSASRRAGPQATSQYWLVGQP